MVSASEVSCSRTAAQKLSVSCHKFLQIITYQDVSFSGPGNPRSCIHEIVIDGYAAMKSLQFNGLIRHCKDLSTAVSFSDDLFQLSLFHMQVSHTRISSSSFFSSAWDASLPSAVKFLHVCRVNRKLIFFTSETLAILINRLLAYDLESYLPFPGLWPRNPGSQSRYASRASLNKVPSVV